MLQHPRSATVLNRKISVLLRSGRVGRDMTKHFSGVVKTFDGKPRCGVGGEWLVVILTH